MTSCGKKELCQVLLGSRDCNFFQGKEHIVNLINKPYFIKTSGFFPTKISVCQVYTAGIQFSVTAGIRIFSTFLFSFNSLIAS
jgi:hypothetical protein